jgi:glycosyltransferase involved in cell wall biosynthesis
MRVLVDACAAHEGGLGTYVASLVNAWHDVEGAASDDLHLLASADFAGAARQQLRSVVVHTFRQGRLSRLRAQYFRVPELIKEIRPDALLSTLPIVPIRRVPCPIVVVCYDLRHEIRPTEFSYSQRAARAIEYRRAYRRASKIVAISNRTARDLVDRHPYVASKVVVAPCGCDHIEAVIDAQRPMDARALAYAHHRNKRPELVIEAWALMHQAGKSVPALTIVGASHSTVIDLQRLCANLRLPQGLVDIRGTLGADDYSRLLGTSRLLVFPSSFEGFGLPVLEALRLHVPVVVTPDPALLEVGGSYVTVASDSAPRSVATAVQEALAADSRGRREAGANWASGFTWRATASAIREAACAAMLERRNA